jgi:hypothetical protein
MAETWRKHGQHKEIKRRSRQEHRESLRAGVCVEAGVGHALREGAIERTGDDSPGRVSEEAVPVSQEDHARERPDELTERREAFSERDDGEAGDRIAQRLEPQRICAPGGGDEPAEEHHRCSEAEGF